MTVVFDPEGRFGVGLPLDREPHMQLVRAVISWAGRAPLPPGDAEQIALQLTGHAWAVAAELRHLCVGLPPDAESRVLAEAVLEEADRRLPQPLLGTLRCVQMRARLVRALYERLDRLAARAAPTGPPL
ncbi:DUF6415 family natural product biosynthesis protein [Streptomyces sp. VTCC 41912]|uniref:DUF6415 family natural product biosynthesis protein n=1 Tax=Streptomyces sp. VTCC 41912 TaxID=3383243 RepID=UPI003896E2D5